MELIKDRPEFSPFEFQKTITGEKLILITDLAVAKESSMLCAVTSTDPSDKAVTKAVELSTFSIDTELLLAIQMTSFLQLEPFKEFTFAEIS